MSRASDTFLEEAGELIETLEQQLLELEAEPRRRDLIDTVFRALHTLKGSGEMFGFTALARFAHQLENVFDEVRAGTATVTPELIGLSLECRDDLSRLLSAGPWEEAAAGIVASTRHRALLSRIEGIASDAAALGTDSMAQATAPPVAAALPRIVSICLRPAPETLRNGMRPDLVLTELAELGTCEARLLFDRVPELEALDPTSCHLGWDIRLDTAEPLDRIEDVFLFFDSAEVEITEPKDTALPEPAPENPEAEEIAPAQTTRVPPAQEASIKVQAQRLDELMDRLGELVIAQARLCRIAEQIGDSALSSAAEEIERLVTGMRDATLSIRMLPIDGVFTKFRRVVRDLSAELDKKVQLVTEGGDTELDKKVIDRLTDPLVHIMRNAIDHGIEDAASREAAGKPPLATITMRARQTGGEVLITVSDDGRGLKTDRIRARAIERGIIDATDELAEPEIHQLIFAPGFSTAEQVSNLSGRGVGLDAVRRFIEDLRGTVEIGSRAGQGADVTLRMPLTLAIIDGLMVRVGGAIFVLPLASVEECVELPATERERASGRALLVIRDTLVPYLRVHELFGVPRPPESHNRVVIANVDGRRVGLVVDDIVGQHQTVIKSLSAFHRHVAGLSGCTILGDGSVALIIDPAALVKNAGTALVAA